MGDLTKAQAEFLDVVSLCPRTDVRFYPSIRTLARLGYIEPFGENVGGWQITPAGRAALREREEG